jgi:hypothetical protein
MVNIASFSLTLFKYGSCIPYSLDYFSARRTPQQQQLQAQQFSQQQQQLLQQQQLQNSLGNIQQLYGFNNQLAALPVTPLTFASEHMGNEFTVIR